jgi:hypothetical protein
VQRYQRLT